MLNKDDRDKSYEDHDESEYQFSEDEVNYELDSESKVETPVTPSSGNIFTRMSRSKRMLISAIVFLGLVFVVYKMVSPTTPPVAPTEIAPAATPAKAVPPAVPQQIAPPEPVVAVTPPPPVPQAVTPESLSANMNVPAAPTAPVANLPPPGTIVQTGAQPAMQVPAQVVSQPMMQPAQTPSMSQPTMAPSISLPTTQQMPTPGSMSQAMQPGVPAVQSQVMQQPIQQPTYPAVQTIAPSVGVMPEIPLTSTPNAMIQTPTIPVAGTQYAETQAAAVMQSEYSQRMNEYVNANRDLQNQMQALNERVITMENQFNQLIRTLTRQETEDRVQAAPPPAPVAQKIPYSVQAIIPGRAWLRSDNGETVTVAEGDIIKDLGRIVKIDPYDGIVEINTGTKVITLTYGTSN